MKDVFNFLDPLNFEQMIQKTGTNREPTMGELLNGGNLIHFLVRELCTSPLPFPRLLGIKVSKKESEGWEDRFKITRKGTI